MWRTLWRRHRASSSMPSSHRLRSWPAAPVWVLNGSVAVGLALLPTTHAQVLSACTWAYIAYRVFCECRRMPAPRSAVDFAQIARVVRRPGVVRAPQLPPFNAVVGGGSRRRRERRWRRRSVSDVMRFPLGACFMRQGSVGRSYSHARFRLCRLVRCGLGESSVPKGCRGSSSAGSKTVLYVPGFLGLVGSRRSVPCFALYFSALLLACLKGKAGNMQPGCRTQLSPLSSETRAFAAVRAATI